MVAETEPVDEETRWLGNTRNGTDLTELYTNYYVETWRGAQVKQPTAGLLVEGNNHFWLT